MQARPGAQRGLPGQLGIGLSMGTVDGFLLRDSRLCYRYWAGLELARYNRNHGYWNFGAGYLHKDYAYDGVTGRQRVPVAQYTAEAGYNLPLAADRGRNVTLYGGLLALVGYETSGNGGKALEDGATLVSGDGLPLRRGPRGHVRRLPRGPGDPAAEGAPAVRLRFADGGIPYGTGLRPALYHQLNGKGIWNDIRRNRKSSNPSSRP